PQPAEDESEQGRGQDGEPVDPTHGGRGVHCALPVTRWRVVRGPGRTVLRWLTMRRGSRPVLNHSERTRPRPPPAGPMPARNLWPTGPRPNPLDRNGP